MWISKAELLNIFGKQMADEILAKLGGTRPYIPKKFTADHRLCKKIRPETLAKLCESFGGENIFLPSITSKPLARDAVNKLLREGVHNDEDIAEKVGVSVRYVSVLKKKHDAKK